MSRTTALLEELNTLLSDSNLDLPSIRRTVDSGGHNLVWLRKHIGQRNTVSERLQELLDTPIRKLAR